MEKERAPKCPLQKLKESEQISRFSFVMPNTGIALGAFLVAFHFDGASKTWSPVRRALLVRPDGHIETVVAAIIGTSLLQGIQQVAGKVDGGSDWGAVSHCVSP